MPSPRARAEPLCAAPGVVADQSTPRGHKTFEGRLRGHGHRLGRHPGRAGGPPGHPGQALSGGSGAAGCRRAPSLRMADRVSGADCPSAPLAWRRRASIRSRAARVMRKPAGIRDLPSRTVLQARWREPAGDASVAIDELYITPGPMGAEDLGQLGLARKPDRRGSHDGHHSPGSRTTSWTSSSCAAFQGGIGTARFVVASNAIEAFRYIRPPVAVRTHPSRPWTTSTSSSTSTCRRSAAPPCCWVRRHLPRVPTVVLTSSEDRAGLAWCRMNGATRPHQAAGDRGIRALARAADLPAAQHGFMTSGGDVGPARDQGATRHALPGSHRVDVEPHRGRQGGHGSDEDLRRALRRSRQRHHQLRSPAGRQLHRGQLGLELRARQGGLPRRQADGHHRPRRRPQAAPAGELAVIDPGGSVAARLTKRGIAFAAVKSVDAVLASARGWWWWARTRSMRFSASVDQWLAIAARGRPRAGARPGLPAARRGHPRRTWSPAPQRARGVRREPPAPGVRRARPARLLHLGQATKSSTAMPMGNSTNGAISPAQCDLSLDQRAGGGAGFNDGLLLMCQLASGASSVTMRWRRSCVRQHARPACAAYAPVRKATAVALDEGTPRGRLLADSGLRVRTRQRPPRGDRQRQGPEPWCSTPPPRTLKLLAGDLADGPRPSPPRAAGCSPGA